MKLFCFVDNPSLADTVHIHTNLIAEPPVHIFFSTMITPSGEDVVRVGTPPSLTSLCSVSISTQIRALETLANFGSICRSHFFVFQFCVFI